MQNYTNPMNILETEYPKLFKSSKKEIFRLQLLNKYDIDSECAAFEAELGEYYYSDQK